MFQKEDEENYDKQELLKKNWNEICYLYDNYDIYDIRYELKAVGLPEMAYFTSCSHGFILNTDVQIIEFETDNNFFFDEYY